MSKPKRDIGYLDIYLGNALIKTISLWGYGYSTLQCANSLNYKYRIISLILYKEWEETNFSEAFEVLIRDWDRVVIPYRVNLDENFMYQENCERAITHLQFRVFACLDAARYIAARVTLRAYAERHIRETIQI